MSAQRTTAASLSCPIPSAISPHADETQLWLAGWLNRRGPHVGAGDRRSFTAVGYARYAARLYPNAEPADLRQVSALFGWFFLLDDAADGASRPDTDRIGGFLTGALGVLRGDPGPTRDFGGPLYRVLADPWRVLRRRMPASWRDRFVDAVRHHFDGVLAEARAKQAGTAPGVARYVELRRATSAAYVAHTLTEFAAREPLPDALYHHQAVRAYSTAGNDLLSWFNDLLSLDRDLATAGGHNLVLALAAERDLPVADAVEAAVRMWRERMDGLPELRAAVPSFGRALDRPVRHFLDGVDRSVRGTIDWSLESIRYRVPEPVAAYL